MTILSGLRRMLWPRAREVTLIKTDWLRTGAACAYLNDVYGFTISHDQLGRWMDEGKLTKRVTPGGRRIFDSGELDGLMDEMGLTH